MAKQRYISDSFWTDPYIEKLSPDFKLVFVYLLTNPLCNISGVYEIRPKRVAYETGYDIEVIETIFKKLTKDAKVIRIKDWIVIINHIKYQSLGDLTAEGINREISKAPKEVRNLFEERNLVNSKGKEYSVLVLKENHKPLIYPLQAPTDGAYSEVELSKVELYNILEKRGEFKNVKLSDEELKKLNERLGENNTKLLIEELSMYMASKNKKYSDHYATILNWARRKVQTHQEKQQSQIKKRTLAVFNPEQK